MLELTGILFGVCALGILILVFLGWILVGGANPETRIFKSNSEEENKKLL
jgi:hypothetical protein